MLRNLLTTANSRYIDSWVSYQKGINGYSQGLNRMSPKFVNREEKAREITRAALAVFSKKGYSAASMDQIAVAAGIAKGTVYEYFPSKDKLFIAAVMVFVDQFETRMVNQLSGIDDPLIRLFTYIVSNIEFCRKENVAETRILFDLLQQCIIEEGVLYHRRYLIREMMSGSRKMLTDILLEGVSRGTFTPQVARDAEKIAISILAFLDGATLHNLITENYFHIPEQLALTMGAVARLILAAPNGYDVDGLIGEVLEKSSGDESKRQADKRGN